MKTFKFVGIFTIIAGILMVLAGAFTWTTVSSQLKSENITVAKITDADPGRLAGRDVAGPFTAYAQADAINRHALEAAKGRTYAQIGDDARALKAKLAATGLSKADVATNPDVVALSDLRDSTAKASLLRASLFTSVVAFGVAALVVGLGVLFGLLGFALLRRDSN